MNEKTTKPEGKEDFKILTIGNNVIPPAEKVSINDGIKIVELCSSQHLLKELIPMALTILKDDLKSNIKFKARNYLG